MSETRRTFLQKSAAASAAFSTFAIGGTKSSGRVLGANDAIRVAICGINGRGTSHIGAYSGDNGKKINTQIAYLVDPDSRLFEKRKAGIKNSSGYEPKCVQDVREALEDGDLDAVTVATPNHWHSLITIWACQAGKDVYVEKPCSQTVHEGRVAVEAARRHGRIVQHGTQSRSSSNWRRQIAAIHSGKYGKLLVSRAYASKPRPSIKFKPAKIPPAELDFNLWIGPGPVNSYNENLVHYNWHWNWDYGNGEIGNQGVHQMDIARWSVPGGGLPKSVVSFGGRYGYEDQGQTPNTQTAIFDFGETKVVFQTRGLVDNSDKIVDNSFDLEAGRIVGGRFYPKGSDQGQSLDDVEFDIGPGDGNFENFIAAVRSRKVKDLNADILEGHLSSAMCHLGNIAFRTGADVQSFDGAAEMLAGDDLTSEEVASMAAHLKGKGVDVNAAVCRVGQRLTVDADHETIADNDLAAALTSRPNRDGFEIPDAIA